MGQELLLHGDDLASAFRMAPGGAPVRQLRVPSGDAEGPARNSRRTSIVSPGLTAPCDNPRPPSNLAEDPSGHRLQMKLGVVPDAERAPEPPDTARHVEPRVGAQTRTKGHLFLLVTSRVPGARARDATRLVADSIRSEYYYDESAGIRVCLVKSIQVANKRLAHARERGALGNGPGPIGVGLAVSATTSSTSAPLTGGGVPQPRRPPLDPSGSAPRPRAAVAESSRTSGAARSTSGTSCSSYPERRRLARCRRAQGRLVTLHPQSARSRSPRASGPGAARAATAP